MLAQSVYTLINQQNGNLSFKVFEFDNNSYFDHIQRNNYFSLIIVTAEEGLTTVDFANTRSKRIPCSLFIPISRSCCRQRELLMGVAIQFHHDFFLYLQTS